MLPIRQPTHILWWLRAAAIILTPGMQGALSLGTVCNIL